MRAVLAVVVAVGSVAANAEPVTIEGKAVEVQVTRPGQGTLTADADVTIEGASMPLKGQSAVEWNPTSGGLRSATLRGPTKWTAGGKLYDLAPGPINFEDRGGRWVSQATLAAPFQLTVDGVAFTAAPGQMRFDRERVRSFMATPATLTIGGPRCRAASLPAASPPGGGACPASASGSSPRRGPRSTRRWSARCAESR